jgi:hypothetical protein
MRTTSFWIALSALAFMLSGCSFLQRNTVGLIKSDYAETKAAAKQRRETVAKAQDQLGEVELLWQIPPEPVDGFVIKYSYEDGSSMERQVKVRASELSKYEDEAYGFVYRYILKEVAAEKPVLVAISAYRGDEISSPSQVVRIDPEGSNGVH